MRKVIVFRIALMLVCVCTLAAQAAPPAPAPVPRVEYIVQSVAGRVERELANGRIEALKPGMKLTATTVIRTGLNAVLVLRLDDRAYTIRAMQNGTVEALIGALAANRGVRIRGTADTSTVNTDSGANRTNISTASTRAEDAAEEEIEWVEEE